MITPMSMVHWPFRLRLFVDALIGVGIPTATAAWASATTYNIVTLPGGSQASGIDNGVAVGGGGFFVEAHHFFGSPAIVWDSKGTATYLQAPPDSNLQSVATTISGNQVTGYLVSIIAPTGHENDIPAVWNRSTGAVTEMSGGWGEVLATDGTHQVGAAGGTTGMGTFATYWSGRSSIQLTLPSDFWGSLAAGLEGNIAVGEVSNGGTTLAGLWEVSGQRSTFANLNPTGYGYSSASAISHGQIVGDAAIRQPNGALIHHAALWTGLTAANFVDLEGDTTTASIAFGTNGTQQVGYVSFDQPVNLYPPADHHAAIWHGTAASLQLLPTPKGTVDSIAYGVDLQGDVVGQMSGPSTGTQAVEWIPNRLPGDADFDGKVDFADLVIVTRNYGKSGNVGFVDGDFNFDGSVGFDDLMILARNYGAPAPTASQLAELDPSVRADVERAFAEVPEPSSFLLLVLAPALTLPRRRQWDARPQQ